MWSSRVYDFFIAFLIVATLGALLYGDTTVYTPSVSPLGIGFGVMAILLGFMGQQLCDHEAKMKRFSFVYTVGMVAQGFLFGGFWMVIAVVGKENPRHVAWDRGGIELAIFVMVIYVASRIEIGRLHGKVRDELRSASTTNEPDVPSST